MIELSKLVQELWDESKPGFRCPFVCNDSKGCFCKLQPTEEAQRMVCDYHSLQLWCLDRERYPLCLYYDEYLKKTG